MNGYQRYRATLAGQPVDHLARLPILMRFAAEAVNAPYGDFCTDWRIKSQGNLLCARRHGLDVVSVMSDPYSETAGFGGEILFHDDATPECPHPPLGVAPDLSFLPRPDPLTSPRMLAAIQTVAAYREEAAGQFNVLGWVEGPAAQAADLRGISRFLMDLIDQPAWCEELMDRCVDVAIDYARGQFEAGADTIGVGDAICSQVSPAIHRSHILPRQQRLFAAIRDLGAVARLHICGDITHLLPALATLPLHILDVDHMVDIGHVRQSMPADVALVCNIDPVADVLDSDPDRIQAAVRERYAAAGNPFFIGAGCEIPPGTPPENLDALCRPVAYQP